MHIELTEMLRCPETHEEAFLVMSTGEMVGRMVRSGILGCPVCRREFPIMKGVVQFSAGEGAPLRDKNTQSLRGAPSPADAQTLQALLDLSGPGGYVVLVGSAARHAVGLAGLMGGIHFVGINAPPEVGELPVLSLLACETMIPLRGAVARGVVVGPERTSTAWLGEALRVLLRGRRLVIEDERVTAPAGLKQLAMGEGMWVGEKQ
ncbi:MAG: hypothetical protein AUH78_10765 [Gemmatimonadetes bacterium 13_1_40CM_4_69_8]|nr:MAG: hypothetical protein AUH45_10005 [Gemmatimonadetes bacterium 13_1_40CM_69_22]OLC74723.1 MAG: hypothetical protein AUH78_10765 [Gemmatimonadetes bacterium 13_1_40CM_4_69_8]